MAHPRFGFSISPGAPLGVAAEAVQAEALGYDRIGIWDSPALFREPLVTLAAAARDTRRIALGTWVTNPLSRHPVVTASAAATLDELALGRTYIGIGSGDTGVMHLGLRAAPLAHLEQYVLAVRRLLEDGQAAYGGQTARLNWAQRHIPILIAAHGAKSLRLAGRIGDGVVVGLGVTPEVIQAALALIDDGARDAGRRLADIEVWFTCFWFVDPEPGAAHRQAGWAAASFASHFARAGLDGKLVPPEYHAALREFGSAYDKVTHGAVPDAQKDEYAALAERLGVRDYFQHRFVFAGTPDEVVGQVQIAAAAGAANFDGAIDAPLPEHQARIAAWARWVLPHFKSP